MPLLRTIPRMAFRAEIGVDAGMGGRGRGMRRPFLAIELDRDSLWQSLR